MNIKKKILMLSIIPVLSVSILSILINFYQFTKGLNEEVKQTLKSTALAALNVYSHQGYGNYTMKEDGNVWRGMNFNVSQDTSIVDDIKEETDIDITFFYEQTAVMTSMCDEEGNRWIGMQAGKNITNYTLLQGAQCFYEKIVIGDEKYHAYIIPVVQSESGEIIGALMATRSTEHISNVVLSNTVTNVIITLVVTLIILSITIIFAKKLTMHLEQAGNILRDVSEGKLSSKKQKQETSSDEIGLLVRNTQILQEKLVEIIGRIKNSSMILNEAAQKLTDTSQTTSNAAQELNHSMTNIAATTTEQAAHTQEASNDIKYMGEIINQSLEDINQIYQLITQMNDLSMKTEDILNDLQDINIQSQEAMDIIYTQTNKTNQSALQITGVTQLITAIAEETNLLSLNASIEAARAGEQGRGFTIVAQQIQKLAEQSNISGRKIEEIIKELSGETNKSVETMKKVKEITETQSKKINETREMFKKLNENVRYSTEKTQEVVKHTQKIDTVKEKMITIIEELSMAAEHNATTTEETSYRAGQVTDEIEKVSELAAQLKALAIDLENNIIFRINE